MTLDTSRQGFGVTDYAGQLRFTTDDPDEPAFTLDLTGSVSSFKISGDDAGAAAFRKVSLNGATDGFLTVNRDTRYHNGNYAYHPEGVGNNLVQWIFGGLMPGTAYELGVSWVGGDGRASDAPFSVWVASGSDAASLNAAVQVFAQDVDQRVDPTGPTGWHTFPLVNLPADRNTIVLQLTDDANGFVLADAAILNVPQPLLAADEVGWRSRAAVGGRGRADL